MVSRFRCIQQALRTASLEEAKPDIRAVGVAAAARAVIHRFMMEDRRFRAALVAVLAAGLTRQVVGFATAALVVAVLDGEEVAGLPAQAAALVALAVLALVVVAAAAN